MRKNIYVLVKENNESRNSFRDVVYCPPWEISYRLETDSVLSVKNLFDNHVNKLINGYNSKKKSFILPSDGGGTEFCMYFHDEKSTRGPGFKDKIPIRLSVFSKELNPFFNNPKRVFNQIFSINKFLKNDKNEKLRDLGESFYRPSKNELKEILNSSPLAEIDYNLESEGYGKGFYVNRDYIFPNSRGLSKGVLEFGKNLMGEKLSIYLDFMKIKKDKSHLYLENIPWTWDKSRYIGMIENVVKEKGPIIFPYSFSGKSLEKDMSKKLYFGKLKSDFHKLDVVDMEIEAKNLLPSEKYHTFCKFNIIDESTSQNNGKIDPLFLLETYGDFVMKKDQKELERIIKKEFRK
jgi:hypothetical protein